MSGKNIEKNDDNSKNQDIFLFDYSKWFKSNPFRQLYNLTLPDIKKSNFPKRFFKKWNRFIIPDVIYFQRFLVQTLNRIDDNAIKVCYNDFTTIQFEKLNLFQLAAFDALKIDMTTYLLYSKIYMNKIAKVLSLFTHNGYSSDSFNSWYINSDKIIEPDLKNIIKNAKWFENVKFMRDKYIVHNAWSDGSIIIHPVITLRFFSYVKNFLEKRISIIDIYNLDNNMHNFSHKLNDYLCKNLNKIPIKVR